jgi:DNA primase
MGIPDEDVAAVRAATDIVALIGEYTPLKRSGTRFQGLCPFHSEKTPSFSVNEAEGLYYCFGCQAAGDAITFLRTIEGLSFVEAVERLGARAGVRIRNDVDVRDSEARDKRKALYDALEQAVAFYHDRLLTHSDAARARQYLRSRGLDGEIVRRFKLGWAPEGGNYLARNLRSGAAALAGAGLVSEGQYGPRDSFRGRIIFPIYQPDGKAVALGGRLVPGIGDGQGPKYRNSPETPIYQKRSTLYALNLARQSIVQSGEVVVCEGYTDVIGFFRVGLPRAVATCGTALTEEHFKLLARFARRLVLAFDADRAGQAAAARVYEWERRHELEVAVADLPEGKDPGELATSDPERLRASIEGARTYLEFRLERALASADLRRPEGRARAAEAAIAVVAEHPNELVRDQYLVQVADRTRIELEQLRPWLKSAVGRAPRTARVRPIRPRPPEGERVGRDALALAIHDPRAMAGRIGEPLFADPIQQAAYNALAGSASLHDAIERSDEDVARLLVELATVEPSVSPDQAVVALVRVRVQEAIAELQAEARSAQANGDEAASLASAPVVARLKSELELFGEVGAGDNPPRHVTEAAGRLLAWLSQRHREAP